MATSDPRVQYGDPWTNPSALGSSDDLSHIATVLDEYVHLRGIGQQPDRAEFLAQHAAIASELSDYLDGLDLVLSAQNELLALADPDDSSNETLAPSTRLGDYQIIREVGRGGMGVVYEAEQLLLGRRVALKVLPSAASLDPRQRQRFQVEAQAAALLQDEHIVPVYGVGCDQGVHYYAMQFIDGRSLAEIIRSLRDGTMGMRADLPDRARNRLRLPADGDGEIRSGNAEAAHSPGQVPQDAGGPDDRNGVVSNPGENPVPSATTAHSREYCRTV